jgi:TonB-linked SusC/RagA family outer membrane protein
MKKQHETDSLYRLSQKLIRIMKLTCFLILTFVLSVSASSYSQSTKLDIQIRNGSLVDALRQIEDQSEFYFYYNNSDIASIDNVSVSINNKKISETLNELLANTGLIYEVIDRYIVIKKKEDAGPNKSIQQEKSVSGKVTDTNGEPLPGASVVIKGTMQGTITDGDGNYNLSSVPGNATLIFSFMGMKTQEVPVAGTNTVNVVLEGDAIGLDEVVAIGYGTAKKRDITGSVGSVKSDLIVRTNPIQPASALQGQVAGVNVKKINSQPGSDYTIDIRGVHSISFSSEPLVVIDGVMGGKLNALNPSDIETMDVLKDASATAIYGARGANGVIIITTKKGTAGKTRVTYDGYVGVKVPQLPDLMTAQEFYHAYNDVVLAENPNANIIWTSQQLANVESGNSVNWVDEVTDPSVQTSHVVALSGGNENTTHYFSAGYLNEKGNLLNTGYERYNLKGSMDSKLNKVVRVGFTTYYTYSKRDLGNFETLRSAYRARPTGTIYYDDLINPTETNDRNVDGYAMWMGILVLILVS